MSRDKPPPTARNYFARRQQVRLMTLVSALLLVCLMAYEASKPKNWRWLWWTADVAIEDAVQPKTQFGIETERPDSLPPGVFLAEPTKRQALGRIESTLDPPTAPEQADFAAVQDDTVFRAAEATIWYRLLDYVKHVPPKQLENDSVGQIGFAQLHASPSAFRGRVVRLRGDIRRAHRLEAPQNDYGIKAYWQCWLFTDRALDPVVVYALDMPSEFPTGMKIQERVSLIGVFFKRWAYSSRSGSRAAPLVVANTATWQRRPAGRELALPNRTSMALAVLGCFVVAAFLAWWANRRIARIRSTKTKAIEMPLDAATECPTVRDATNQFLGDLDGADEN